MNDLSLHMFLKNAIERILADPATKRKEHAQLKKACESALGIEFVTYHSFIMIY